MVIEDILGVNKLWSAIARMVSKIRGIFGRRRPVTKTEDQRLDWWER